MSKLGEGMYTDAQWAWLFDRHCEGYTVVELAKFAHCNKETISYHWLRMGLRREKAKRPALNRREFEALGRRS